jgi:Fe-S oxidoreductase
MARTEFMGEQLGENLLHVMAEIKTSFDPHNLFNPGKIVHDGRFHIDENLRLGATYRPTPVKTYFSFPEDHGHFPETTLRCVGVSKCRKDDGGTMCPSYMVTREEKHSTRGHARLLFEMLRGDPLEGGWKNEYVKEALDLCLACKACKSECPINVDMATYKAEFLAHYYEDRQRPRAAYAMGLIYRWAGLARLAPWLANLLGRMPGTSHLIKFLGGISQKRRVPAFASPLFTDWFRRRPFQNISRPKVILWPDTFSNNFNPEIAKAAVAVLEHAGYQVTIPETSLCCGRPLYDFGMLDEARATLKHTLAALRTDIAAGTPIIGLEPS